MSRFKPRAEQKVMMDRGRMDRIGAETDHRRNELRQAAPG